jgi:hypothetical protein
MSGTPYRALICEQRCAEKIMQYKCACPPPHVNVMVTKFVDKCWPVRTVAFCSHHSSREMSLNLKFYRLLLRSISGNFKNRWNTSTDIGVFVLSSISFHVQREPFLFSRSVEPALLKRKGNFALVLSHVCTFSSTHMLLRPLSLVSGLVICLEPWQNTLKRNRSSL